MKSDIDDPNNHVPEVSPDDDWDDLDAGSEKSKMGLPPRRNDRGLPPKKETKGAMVNRQPKAIQPRLIQERVGLVVEEDSEVETETESKPGKNPKKASKKTAKKAARKSAEKKPKKTAKKAAKKAAKKRALESPAPGLEKVEEELSNQEVENGIRLPTAPAVKQNRVTHRIGMGDAPNSDPRPGSRPIQKISITPGIEKSETSDEEVARMRRRFVRGERQDWGEEKGRDSVNWMIYTGVSVVVLVVLAVFLSQMGGGEKTRESDKSLYSKLELAEEPAVGKTDDPELFETLSNSQQDAKNIYGKFATAATPADFSEFFFNKDQVISVVVNNWKSLGIEEGWIPGEDAFWSALDRNGQSFGVLEGSHPDFTDFRAFFRKEGEGLKLDWKATVGYCTASFDEMKAGSGDASEVRAWISLADFYTFAIPEEKFRSFRLISPDGNANLWAYTERDGELDQKLVKLFIPSQITGEAETEVQVTLRMEPGPDDGLKTQWLIRGLSSLSWLDELPK